MITTSSAREMDDMVLARAQPHEAGASLHRLRQPRSPPSPTSTLEPPPLEEDNGPSPKRRRVQEGELVPEGSTELEAASSTTTDAESSADEGWESDEFGNNSMVSRAGAAEDKSSTPPARPFALLTAQGRLVSANPEFTKQLGLDQANLSTTTLLDLVSPEELYVNISVLEQLFDAARSSAEPTTPVQCLVSAKAPHGEKQFLALTLVRSEAGGRRAAWISACTVCPDEAFVALSYYHHHHYHHDQASVVQEGE